MTEISFTLSDLIKEILDEFLKKGYYPSENTYEKRAKNILGRYCKIFHIDYKSFKKNPKRYALDAVAYDSIFFCF